MSLGLFIIIFSFLVGITVGSFVNVLILRLPEGGDVVFEESHCPVCKKSIRWYENIPLLSYLFLRGKCSGCGTRISFQYPLIELITGLFCLLILPKDLTLPYLLTFSLKLSVFACFLTIFVVDIRHQIIPNYINLFLFIVLSLVSLFMYNWTHIVFGLLIGVGFPGIVTWAFYKLKGQIGLGMGDIKLYGALSVYLGPMGIIQNIFLSCFSGSFIIGLLMLLNKVKRDTKIPFGPFIVLVAFFQFYYPEYFNQVMKVFLFSVF